MKKVKTSVMYILLSLWTLVNLFPLYWMFTFSLKTNKEIFGDNIISTAKRMAVEQLFGGSRYRKYGTLLCQ